MQLSLAFMVLADFHCKTIRSTAASAVLKKPIEPCQKWWYYQPLDIDIFYNRAIHWYVFPVIQVTTPTTTMARAWMDTISCRATPNNTFQTELSSLTISHVDGLIWWATLSLNQRRICTPLSSNLAWLSPPSSWWCGLELVKIRGKNLL